jgi:hypothetical protein
MKKDTIYNFYLNTNEHTYEPILLFKGTLSAFEKVDLISITVIQSIALQTIQCC